MRPPPGPGSPKVGPSSACAARFAHPLGPNRGFTPIAIVGLCCRALGDHAGAQECFSAALSCSQPREHLPWVTLVVVTASEGQDLDRLLGLVLQLAEVLSEWGPQAPVHAVTCLASCWMCILASAVRLGREETQQEALAAIRQMAWDPARQVSGGAALLAQALTITAQRPGGLRTALKAVHLCPWSRQVFGSSAKTAAALDRARASSLVAGKVEADGIAQLVLLGPVDRATAVTTLGRLLRSMQKSLAVNPNSLQLRALAAWAAGQLAATTGRADVFSSALRLALGALNQARNAGIGPSAQDAPLLSLLSSLASHCHLGMGPASLSEAARFAERAEALATRFGDSAPLVEARQVALLLRARCAAAAGDTAAALSAYQLASSPGFPERRTAALEGAAVLRALCQPQAALQLVEGAAVDGQSVLPLRLAAVSLTADLEPEVGLLLLEELCDLVGAGGLQHGLAPSEATRLQAGLGLMLVSTGLTGGQGQLVEDGKRVLLRARGKLPKGSGVHAAASEAAARAELSGSHRKKGERALELLGEHGRQTLVDLATEVAKFK